MAQRWPPASCRCSAAGIRRWGRAGASSRSSICPWTPSRGCWAKLTSPRLDRPPEPVGREPAVVAQAAGPAAAADVEAPHRARRIGEISPQARGATAEDLVGRATQAEPLLARQVPEAEPCRVGMRERAVARAGPQPPRHCREVAEVDPAEPAGKAQQLLLGG